MDFVSTFGQLGLLSKITANLNGIECRAFPKKSAV